jgi:hypothetical protein
MGPQFKDVKATVLLYLETGYQASRTVGSNRAIFGAVSFHKPSARFFLSHNHQVPIGWKQRNRWSDFTAKYSQDGWPMKRTEK